MESSPLDGLIRSGLVSRSDMTPRELPGGDADLDLANALLGQGLLDQAQLVDGIRLIEQAQKSGRGLTLEQALRQLKRIPEDRLEAVIRSLERRLGRFRLIRKLGEGGSGEVWQAEDTDLKRIVALKLLSHLADRDIERFTREARVMAQLSHPDIVQIYGFEQIDGKHVLSMQYVEGKNLDNTKLPIPEALKVAHRVAGALAAAHELGIVHRDVKPSNILRAADGHVYLSDFGIAKVVERGNQKTLSVTGSVIGTPEFMSPEQAKGEVHSIDARSDIYGLGATLYTLVAGKVPFEGITFYEIAHQVVTDDPPPARKVNPEIPVSVEAVIARAMSKDKADRYASSLEFARDLERAMAGEPVEARPLNFTTVMFRRLAKHRILVLTNGLMLLVAATVVAVLLWPSSKAEDRIAEAETHFKGKKYFETLSDIEEIAAKYKGSGAYESRKAEIDRWASVCRLELEGMREVEAAQGHARQGEWSTLRRKLARLRGALADTEAVRTSSVALAELEKQLSAAQVREDQAEATLSQASRHVESGNYDSARDAIARLEKEFFDTELYKTSRSRVDGALARCDSAQREERESKAAKLLEKAEGYFSNEHWGPAWWSFEELLSSFRTTELVKAKRRDVEAKIGTCRERYGGEPILTFEDGPGTWQKDRVLRNPRETTAVESDESKEGKKSCVLFCKAGNDRQIFSTRIPPLDEKTQSISVWVKSLTGESFKCDAYVVFSSNNRASISGMNLPVEIPPEWTLLNIRLYIDESMGGHGPGSIESFGFAFPSSKKDIRFVLDDVRACRSK